MTVEIQLLQTTTVEIQLSHLQLRSSPHRDPPHSLEAGRVDPGTHDHVGTVDHTDSDEASAPRRVEDSAHEEA